MMSDFNGSVTMRCAASDIISTDDFTPVKDLGAFVKKSKDKITLAVPTPENSVLIEFHLM